MTSDTCADIATVVKAVTGAGGPQLRFADEIADRRVEYDAIVDLLVSQATPDIPREEAMRVARAVAAACLGEQHLWRDMGLPNRLALRTLLAEYFAPLAADNIMDMRWKKFIYRRLCRWGGFHTCTAPSCGECPTYAECFGDDG